MIRPFGPFPLPSSPTTGSFNGLHRKSNFLAIKRNPRRSAKRPKVAPNYRAAIGAGRLAASQFPDTLSEKFGTFTKLQSS